MVALCRENMIEIKIDINFLTIGFILILVVYVIQLFNEIVATGIRAMLDLIFKNYITLKAVFIDQLPIRSNSLSEKIILDKNSHKVIRTRRTYFKIVIQCHGKYLVFISQEYLEIEKGKKYLFLIAATSQIIVSVDEIKS